MYDEDGLTSKALCSQLSLNLRTFFIKLLDVGQITHSMPQYIQHKSTLWFSILCILSIFLFLGACNNSRISKLNERDARYVGKIKISAGDHIDYIENDTLNFLAFPMNVALYAGNKEKAIKVYVIGKSVKKEKSVGFRPFALLRKSDQNGKVEQIVLARPVSEDLVTAKVDNYFEFISVHYGVQKLIEAWVKNADGYGSVKDVEWFNEEAAIKFLEL